MQLASEVTQNYIKLRDVQECIRLGAESAKVQTQGLIPAVDKADSRVFPKRWSFDSMG